MTYNSRIGTQASGERGSEGLTVPAALAREPLPVPSAGSAAPPAEQHQPAPPVAGSGPGDVQAKLQFAEQTHQYIRDFIKLGDQKATFFFTGATALLAFLYRNGVSARWLRPVMDWNILDVFAFVAMVALAIGAVMALVVIIPRTPGSRRGFVFWEAIAEYDSGRQYADDLAMMSTGSLYQIKAEHCFDLARVCRSKYKFLRFALWIGAIGLAASLLVFLTSGIRVTTAPHEAVSAPAPKTP